MSGLPETGLTLIRAAIGERFLRRWEIHERGQGLVPETGPVIIAANHSGWLDGPLLFVKAPRKVHALTKSDEFEGRNGLLLRAISQIKVHRDRVDTRALRQAVSALEAGQAVGIFPEGLRGDGELTRIKQGIGYLALVSGAPIVPLAIFGTREEGAPSDFRPEPGARIDLVYGDPFSFDPVPWPRTSLAIEETTEQIHRSLLDHLEHAKSVTSRTLPGPLPAGATDV